LVAAGARVAAYDPEAEVDISGMEQVDTVAAALQGADAVLVATEWPEFAALEPAGMAELMRGRVIVDARNVIDKEAAAAAGFDYRGVGR
jgi:UDPglucose 6-dehydrogenase